MISNKKWISGGIIALMIVLALGLLVFNKVAPGNLDGFARCLDEQGALFYGAFWCPHCQKQKALFGRSEKYLPYIECSTPDSRGQLPVCKENDIKSYPTWEFKDGSRLTGEIPLATLAEKTGCVLP